MKNNFLFFLLLLFTNHFLAQDSSSFEIGFTKKIHSEILNENREYFIYLPEELKKDPIPDQNYPVAIILDAENFFIPFIGHVKSLTSAHMLIPRMIVIGIPNTNRWRDLAPTKTPENPPYLPDFIVQQAGGGDKFLDFIEKELIPEIEENYPTISHRILVGHSLGGVLALHTFLNRTSLFDNYLVLDPAVWWNDQYLIQEFKEKLVDQRFSKKSIFVGNANYITEHESRQGSTAEDYPEGSMEAKEELARILQNRFADKVKLKVKDYTDENHMTVVHIGQYDGMRFLYNDFNLPTFIPSALTNFEDGFLEMYNQQFENLSKRVGAEIKPYEDNLGGIGYFLMSMGLYEEAESLYKVNTQNFPDSFMAWNTLGDCYAAQGETEKAKEAYRKSVSLNKDSPAKEKLK